MAFTEFTAAMATADVGQGFLWLEHVLQNPCILVALAHLYRWRGLGLFLQRVLRKRCGCLCANTSGRAAFFPTVHIQ